MHPFLNAPAGTIVRALRQSARATQHARRQDPRVDLMLDVGLLLGTYDRAAIDPEAIKLLRSWDANGVEYTVTVEGKVVFEALFAEGEMAFSTLVPGPWIARIAHVVEARRLVAKADATGVPLPFAMEISE
jgi:hypothetical protein